MFLKLLKSIFKHSRIIGVAFMLALANVYKGELRTIDDTSDKIEHVDQTRDNDENYIE